MPSLPPESSRRNAFTLIELIVVISIIALLLALLLPALKQAQDTAQAVQCLSNERQIMLAMFVYRDDFGGFPQVPNVGVAAANRWGWVGGLFSYLGGHQPTPGQNWTASDFPEVGRCPAPVANEPSNPWTYGGNYPVTIPYSRNPAYGYRPSQPPTEDFLKRTVMFVDAYSMFAYSPAYWPPTVDTDGDGIADTHSALTGSVATRQGGLRFRHGGGRVAHFAFSDGSAASGDRAYAYANSTDIWGKYLLD